MNLKDHILIFKGIISDCPLSSDGRSMRLLISGSRVRAPQGAMFVSKAFPNGKPFGELHFFFFSNPQIRDHETCSTREGCCKDLLDVRKGEEQSHLNIFINMPGSDLVVLARKQIQKKKEKDLHKHLDSIHQQHPLPPSCSPTMENPRKKQKTDHKNPFYHQQTDQELENGSEEARNFLKIRNAIKREIAFLENKAQYEEYINGYNAALKDMGFILFFGWGFLF